MAGTVGQPVYSNRFYNDKLFHNIRKESYFLKIYSTGGMKETNLIGDLPDFSTVRYHTNGITNIIPLSKLKKRYSVTCDNIDGDAFDVNLPDGRIHSFVETPTGLYHSYVRDRALSSENNFINTVENNKSKDSKRDYLRAVNTRRLQNVLGNRKFRKLKNILKDNNIKKNPFNESNADTTEYIFGSNIKNS